MPIYEYRCATCGKTFEVIQKFSDAPLAVHADCGGQVERLISAPSFQFKGSGWYVTDYAKGGGAKSEAKSDTKADSNGKGESGNSESAKRESKTDSAKTESKPETKSESKPAAPAAKND
jgi:putative FmdB family regulatory protein